KRATEGGKKQDLAGQDSKFSGKRLKVRGTKKRKCEVRKNKIFHRAGSSALRSPARPAQS
ncbi:hypothetical protein LJC22_03435, partial [Desulfosarcina sp. OttesenSCG-928-G10]|nr:hypothetical protein [Desulfosarcina sp. OttesenSCG-928-G10]